MNRVMLLHVVQMHMLNQHSNTVVLHLQGVFSDCALLTLFFV